MSVVKGHLLHIKRAPFTHQKSTFCNAKDRLLLFKCETTLHKRHIQGVWKIREYRLNRIKKGCAKQLIAHPFL